jgi:protease-4
MNRRSLALLAVVFGGFFVLFLVFLGLAFAALRGETHARPGTDGPRIGVVELRGVIGDPRNGIDGSREAEQVRDFAEDDDVKGILVRIESPGGAVAPSQEINEEIQRARARKKVVCSLGQTAASGGYYIAVACDRIVANRGTLTGSIGVISQFMSVPEWLEIARVQQTTLKTGALKDAGSPFRTLTDEDRAYFEKMLDRIYQQFLAAVAEGRGKKVEEIRPLADGRVFTGEEALELGLVDKLGNFRTALDELMAISGLEGEPQLVRPERKDDFRWLELLRGDARSVAREVARGAVDGLSQRPAGQGGVMLLAPWVTP